MLKKHRVVKVKAVSASSSPSRDHTHLQVMCKSFVQAFEILDPECVHLVCPGRPPVRHSFEMLSHSSKLYLEVVLQSCLLFPRVFKPASFSSMLIGVSQSSKQNALDSVLSGMSWVSGTWPLILC